MQTNFQDVVDFHQRAGFQMPATPTMPHRDVMAFRIAFIQEELDELRVAALKGDIVNVADALADIVYVAMGTAVIAGIPWQEVWDEVQRSNLDKVQGPVDSSGFRKIQKPEGWVPPRIGAVLAAAMAKEDRATELREHMEQVFTSGPVDVARARADGA